MNFRLYAVIATVLVALNTTAQTQTNNAFAITSEHKGAFEWTEVKLINLNNGEVVSNVFESSKGQYNVYDGRSARKMQLNQDTASAKTNDRLPFSGLSAA